MSNDFVKELADTVDQAIASTMEKCDAFNEFDGSEKSMNGIDILRQLAVAFTLREYGKKLYDATMELLPDPMKTDAQLILSQFQIGSIMARGEAAKELMEDAKRRDQKQN